ncbi:MAG: hypothetical protein IT361_15105 [Gemmatimonadaceae bacterium]|nr:hypothetical protein [Gemmatimonadaceae bacterium]
MSATASFVRDPVTLQPSIQYQWSVNVFGSLSVHLVIASVPQTCQNNYASVLPNGAVADPTKRPLILVHGLVAANSSCDDFDNWSPDLSYWEDFTPELQLPDNTGWKIDDEYQIWYLKYPSNEGVDAAADALHTEIQKIMAFHNGKRATLVAHSLGGVVARRFLKLHDGRNGNTPRQRVDRVLTLGSPHEGTPAADSGWGTGVADARYDLESDAMQQCTNHWGWWHNVVAGKLAALSGSQTQKDVWRLFPSGGASYLGSDDDVVVAVSGTTTVPAIDYDVVTEAGLRILGCTLELHPSSPVASNDHDGFVAKSSARPAWARAIAGSVEFASTDHLMLVNKTGIGVTVVDHVKALLKPVPSAGVLVAHYKFDGNADDVTANPINGTLTNALFVPGRVGTGSAVRFAGGTSLMNAPVTPSSKLAFKSTDQFTVALWMKPDQLPPGPDNMLVYSMGRNDMSASVQLQPNATPFVSACTPTESCHSAYASTGSAPTGQWHHVTQVFDGVKQTMSLYYDGAFVSTVGFSFSARAIDVDFSVGSVPYTSANAFRGSVDDVRVYRGMLSPATIAALANIPAPPTPPIPTGLAAFYPLDGNGDDSSGNSNHGTALQTTTVAGHDGKANTAMSFGPFGVVSVPSNPILAGLTNDLTLVFWVRKQFTPLGVGMIPVSRREPGNVIHFLAYLQPGGSGFQCCSAGGSATGMFYAPNGNGLTTMNDGQWHQVAIVRRFGPSGFTEVYLDGNPVPGTYTSGAATAAAPAIVADLLIGRQASTSPGQFDGFIDNVYIFNRILTQTQIISLP